MPSVLFVCTANRFRSPLAAAWFQRRLQLDSDAHIWRVASAGTWADPGLGIFPSAHWVGEHFGLDLHAHNSVRIDLGLLTDFNLILVMEKSHQEALQVEFPQRKDNIFLLTQVAAGLAYDVQDPMFYDQRNVLEIAGDLEKLIEQGFDEICILARSLQR